MDESEHSENSFKKLFFVVRRFDLAVGQKPPVMLREVTIPDQCSSSVMLQHIRKELGLLDEDIVFKLRNQRGSLIIPKGSIKANTIDMPYNLDIARVHQSMKPKDRSIHFTEPDEMTRAMLKNFVARVDRIEEQMPDLTARRNYRIEREIQDIDRQLSFLKKRLEEADQVEWKGTLKNNPLW